MQKMSSLNITKQVELVYIIVNYGMGSKVLSRAKEYGFGGGTVFFGRGTVSNPILNFFSLYDERKEIIVFGLEKDSVENVLQKLDKEFHFKKPNHGIVFTIGMCSAISSLVCIKKAEVENDKVEVKNMYQLITTIVERGRAEEVIEAAQKAGSRGGTIINARGGGVEDTAKIFNMEIEAEKETVWILSKADETQKIVDAIRDALEIEKPGNGIIFIQAVQHALGIYGDH